MLHTVIHSSELDGRHRVAMKRLAATIAPSLNVRRSPTDPRRDLRFAAYPRDTVYSNRAKFGLR